MPITDTLLSSEELPTPGRIFGEPHGGGPCLSLVSQTMLDMDLADLLRTSTL